MKLAPTLILASLSVIGIRLDAQESPSADSRPQPRVPDDAPRGDAWVKVLRDNAKRGTLQDAFQYVRGDSGKWNDNPILQHAPPIGQKPARVTLDEWADQLLEQDFQNQPGDENWLFLRTRQLDDNDRAWIERIERRGNQFTVVANEAVWQGKYQKTFTYYSVFGINLGKLEAGMYEVKCVIKPLAFQRFKGDGRPRDAQGRDNWPKDEQPADQKQAELIVTFNITATSNGGAVGPR